MSDIVISEERDLWKALYSNAREVTPVPSKNTASDEVFVKALKRRNAANFLCQLAWERNLDPQILLTDHDFGNHAANCAALNDLDVSGNTAEERAAKRAKGASKDIPASTLNRFERLAARTGNTETAGTDRYTISEQCRKMQRELRDAPSALAGQFASKFLAKDAPMDGAVEALSTLTEQTSHEVESVAVANEDIDLDF